MGRCGFASCAALLVPLWAFAALGADHGATKVLFEARRLLELGAVSYVYGGSSIDDFHVCDACANCLDTHKPKAELRLSTCPQCRTCSLDCSHFTEFVFRKAGMPYPYLNTQLMLDLSAADLFNRYGLVDLGRDVDDAAPGDLLVYQGHVVLLESRDGRGRGDLIHSTAGQEVRGGGNAIQRARQTLLADFRGPLLRVLRHREMVASRSPAGTGKNMVNPGQSGLKPHPRFRKITPKPR